MIIISLAFSFLWIIAWAVVPLVFFLLGLIFIGAYSYNVFFNKQNLTYNEDALFIKTKGQEIIIPFEDIELIKITPLKRSWRTTWKIIYKYAGKENTVYFSPRYGLVSILKFKNIAKLKNPKLDVAYITLSVEI